MNVAIDKCVGLAELKERVAAARAAGRKIAFTNGVFDVLHVGHVRLLNAARAEGDLLIVAINSDDSVRRLQKGDDRPIHPEADRAELLAAFAAVDFVIVFADDTPIPLLETLRPDALVKGGDWGPHQVVGREVVEGYGGRVLQVPMVRDRSTTRTVTRIRAD